MSNIDKRALREAAANVKIAGEAPVMPFDQRITALNDFLKHCTPETVLVLLDEIAELEQRHCGTALLEREEMHTKTLGRMLDELDAKDRRIAELELKLEAAEKRIAELEARLETADKLQDSAFRHGLQHGFSLGQTDNQAGFEECLSAYGTGKGE
ncbi:TPA: ead/Ea22-like family protein [Enterobacter kobei]|uniref:ead/Ea22-like family protein n=1 Tax=Enterobacter kobei TaxID=208224 RepID=UPI0029831E4A|nr:ead/Ea22-like family protein [Enterobacter kobei]HEG1930070.1 ead/Ea22-like family protein [Enterobacter kobei]